MKTIIKEKNDLYLLAAERITEILENKPNAVITMAAGRTMFPLWELVIDRFRQGRVHLSEVRFFQTAEMEGVDYEKTFRYMTERYLLNNTDLDPANCVWLSEHAPQETEDLLRAAGGLDLAVLGIGENAHIGLNEPATPFFTGTRRQKLTDRTKKQYAWMFGDENAVPATALTLGIRTLTEAKTILMLAIGKEKAQATFDMLYARNDSVIPAAFLQIPSDVTVYADLEAGSKL